MFDEIRYEFDGVEIARNTGITNTLKNYATISNKKSWRLENAGWDFESKKKSGNFYFCVPLNILLGYSEDYKRVVINARHRLLIRARSDSNCILTQEDDVELTDITLTKVQ